jgi:hypothetical protein
MAELLSRDELLEIRRSEEHDLAPGVADPLRQLQRRQQMPDLRMHGEADALAAKRLAIHGPGRAISPG